MITRSFSRWAPLRVSLWAAAWFLLIRLVYRIVFLGASGGGLLLWNIHPVHLPGPFSLITIGGRVTTGGLLSTVLDALPFAALIVACGLLFSLVDARRLIAETARFRFGRGVLTAIAIGVSTYPSLVTSWRSIRQVHRFRRESGRFSVFAPLFERTLERSQTLAASMEVRGFGRSSHPAEPDCAAPLSASSVCLLWSQRSIEIPDFTFALGDIVLLEGPTGSGKTTLLRAIAGLHTGFDHGSMTGSIRVGGIPREAVSAADTASFVGFVSQRVRDSFVAATVEDELGFGLQMQGMVRASREVRLREVTTLLGIEHLLARRVETLSAGQAVLVAIGAALATRPTLLLLDEPFAELDSLQSQFVASTLAHLAAHTQMCIVIAEHRTAFVSGFATQRITLAPEIQARSQLASSRDAHGNAGAHPIAALVGPNGCGKTTRLVSHALANETTVTLIPESLGDFFTRDTVRGELARSDHTARAPRGTTEGLLLDLLNAPVDADMHPRDLSAGQQLALAISIGLAGRPRELLIDEPTRGLDARTREELAALLGQAAQHTTITVASHDDEFITAVSAVRQEVFA